jgi:serine/threonine protein kinase/predicted RNA-binding protein with RPS1 domain
MGVVYAATHVELDRVDAIKLLQIDYILETARRSQPELVSDEQALLQYREQVFSRFKLEARSTAKIRHVNVAEVYDYDVLPNDEAYIRMEMVEGPTLQKHLAKSGPLPIPLAVSIARQVASGIQAAHKKGILHRDLKPANIMLAEADEDEGDFLAKVVDFGLAKFLEETLSAGGLTASGMMLGTPMYMAPEQWTGGDLSARSDIYSFGVMLFEMLTGRYLFQAKNIASLMHKHLIEAPTRLRDLRPDAPELLETLIFNLLEKEPDKRIGSAGEVARQLREIEQSSSVIAQNARPISTTTNQFLENPTVIRGTPQAGQMDSDRGQPSATMGAAVDLPPTIIEPLAPQPQPSVQSQAPPRAYNAYTPWRVSKVRLYDLAKELRIDTKRLIEEVRREGVDVTVPSNLISKELADKIRNKYFPKKESVAPRAVRVVKKPKPVEAEAASPDIDFGAMLDQFEREQAAFQEGEVVRGTVISIIEHGIIVDFGYKSEGIVPQAEFMNNGQLTVKTGDEVELLIKNMESPDGRPILSRVDAIRVRVWDELERAYSNGTPVRGKIVERIKGGLRVDIDGIAAFLPGSQVDTRPVRNLDGLRNQEIEAKIIKINRRRSNVVLSRKAVLEEQNEGKKGEILNQIEEDIIVEGQIKTLTDYGAFVDLGGIDGLLHVTDMCWGRLPNPAELFKVGDTVQVKVLEFDRERERVSLGYKQLLPDPWQSVDVRYPVGKRLKGQVTSVTDYGAFVEFEPGVEGLIHVSEMGWSNPMKHPSNLVSVGETVDVKVLNIDKKTRRIHLSMKQTQPYP